jgi:hypothetical protein
MSSLADLGPAVSALGSSSVLVAASFVTWRVGCAGARAVEARSTVVAVGTISTKISDVSPCGAYFWLSISKNRHKSQ